MGFLGRKLTDEQRAEELFSPYIDSQLSAEERSFLERYLAAHPKAREKFDLMKHAVQLTKTLPPVKAPRSFVLPRAMARRPSLALRLYPAMRLATVATVALFAFALVGDLASSSRFAASAPEASVVMSAKSAEPEATAAPTMEALAALAPDAAPTATAQTGIAGAAQATPTPVPTPSPEAAAAATESPADQESDRTRQAAPPTLEPAPAETAIEAPPAEEPPAPAPIDPLRAAVIALAAVAIGLTVATLILRQRVQ